MKSIYTNDVLSYKELTKKDKTSEAKEENVVDTFSVFYYTPDLVNPA